MMQGTGFPTKRLSASSASLHSRLVLSTLGLVLIALASTAMAQDVATFKGKVFDAKMKPVEGATVTLVKADDPNVKATATTDKKGEYTLTMATAGDFKLRAEKQGHGPGERPAKAELGMFYADADLQLGDEAAYLQNQAIDAFNAGVKNLQAGKPEAAIADFKKSSEINPKLPQPVYAMAAAYHGLKKWPEAAAALDQYQALAPTDTRPELYGLAFEVYFEAGQDDKAKAALAKISDPETKKGLAPRVYNAGVAKSKAGDNDGAVERFALAAELDPGFDQAHQNIAAIEFNRRNYKAALTHIDMLLKTKPDSVEGLRMRYYALRALDDNRMDGALKAYLAKAPNSAAEEVAKIAGEDFDSGNTALATKTLETLLEVKPDVAVAHYHLGRALASAGANASAKSHLQQFLNMAPNHPDAKAAKEMMAAL
jgi:tetratricopeptide (TPR) repeat protein